VRIMSLWSHRTPAVAGLLSCFACCYSPFNGSQRLGRGFHSKKLRSRCEPDANRPPQGGRPPDCHRIPSRRQASGEGRPSDKIEHLFEVRGVSSRSRAGGRGAPQVAPVSCAPVQGPNGAMRPIRQSRSPDRTVARRGVLRAAHAPSPTCLILLTRLTSLMRKPDATAVGHLLPAGSAGVGALAHSREDPRIPESSGAPPRATRAPGARAGRPSRGSRPRPGGSRAARPRRKVPRERRATGADRRPGPPTHATPYPSSPCHPPVCSNPFLSATFDRPPRLPRKQRARP